MISTQDKQFLEMLMNKDGTGGFLDGDGANENNEDIFLMSQLICQEKAAPEILPCQALLLNEISEVVTNQVLSPPNKGLILSRKHSSLRELQITQRTNSYHISMSSISFEQNI